jgi:hypothetical protein
MRPSLHSITIYFPTFHLTSPHLTSLHFISLPFQWSSPLLRLIYQFPNPFPKLLGLQEKVPKTSNEVHGENLPERHFVHHKFHMTRPGFEPGPPRWEASDQPLELWSGHLPVYLLLWLWESVNVHLMVDRNLCLHSSQFYCSLVKSYGFLSFCFRTNVLWLSLYKEWESRQKLCLTNQPLHCTTSLFTHVFKLISLVL